MMTAGTAWADAISGVSFSNQAHCDVQADTSAFTHELGEAPAFSLDTRISVSAQLTTQTVCVADDGHANDWQVSITNDSGRAWKNLFYIADLDVEVGNYDGYAQVPNFDPSYIHYAFKIDSSGSNANLLSESGQADMIFSPGETWTFLITNLAISTDYPPPRFGSVGVGGNSPGYNLSNGSIVAQVVPIPAAAWLFGSGLAGLGWAARRRRG